MEVSIILDNKNIYEYNSLSKKQRNKLYSLGILGVSMLNMPKLITGEVSLDFTWINASVFGFRIWWLLVIVGIVAALSLLESLSKDDVTIKKFLISTLKVVAILGLGFLVLSVNIPVYMF